MNRDRDLLFAIIALKLTFIRGEDLLACGTGWTGDPDTTLADMLVMRGHLLHSARKAIDTLVDEHIVSVGEGLASKALAAVPLDEHLQRWLQALTAESDVGVTLLEWTADSAPRPGPEFPDGLNDDRGNLDDTIDAAESLPDALPGRIFVLRVGREEKYEFLSEIGRGGLGRVLSALDRDLDREVAVKMMLPGHKSSQAIERFLLEGRVAGRLPHPNIVPIHEIGILRKSDGDAPYFTMAHIKGKDLRQILTLLQLDDAQTHEEFTRGRLLRIFQEVCNAMAYAHDHGVIHRDLKPANIMVGEYGEVFVVDWGLAKVLGTPDPPEEPDQPDQSSAGEQQTEQPRIETDLPDSRIGDASRDVASDLGQGIGPSDARPFGQDDGQQNRGPNQVDQSAPEGHQVDQEKPKGQPTDQVFKDLTFAGQVLGTPAYMSPEQAQGRIGEVDGQSDIFSLGAILYEILTLQQPFEGSSLEVVMSKVLEEEPVPPSERIRGLRHLVESQITPATVLGDEAKASAVEKPAFGPDRVLPRTVPDAVSQELDEICRRALAKDKTKRTGSAKELSAQIQTYLDGEQEKARNHALALAKIEEGRAYAATLEDYRGTIGSLRARIARLQEGLTDSHPMEDKFPLWECEDEIQELGEKVVETFTQAVTAFQEALGFERENAEARAALADLYWDQFLREEESGDIPEMLLYRNLVRQYDDGRYDERLKGDGQLILSVHHYPCRCLQDGREVPCAQMDNMGYHPESGRSLDGQEGAEGRSDLESPGALKRRVHGPDCRTEPLAEAEVWILAYGENRRILLPRAPEGLQLAGAEVKPIPPSMLDGCFMPDSPYRPETGLHLCLDALGILTLPMGSYLLLLHREGYHPVRIPLLVNRLAQVSLTATLFRIGEVPSGFAQVAAGRFIAQGDPKNPYSGPAEGMESGEVFLQTHPVTCADYLEFLHHLAALDGEEARARSPRTQTTSGYYWPRDGDGNIIIPTEDWQATSGIEGRESLSRLLQGKAAFEPDWPVLAVSWEDAMSYAAWRSAEDGYLYTLPHDLQWEKAARGADGRAFPWGNTFDGSFCNTNNSLKEGMKPKEIDAFPLDEAPCGVRGLGGNSSDMCLNSVSSTAPHIRIVCGGNWLASSLNSRSTRKVGTIASQPRANQGFRLLALPVVPVPDCRLEEKFY